LNQLVGSSARDPQYLCYLRNPQPLVLLVHLHLRVSMAYALLVVRLICLWYWNREDPTFWLYDILLLNLFMGQVDSTVA
jgi:hypothetical protein